MNQNSQEIGRFDPQGRGANNNNMAQIKENEMLMGVYGVKGKN